MQSALCAIFVCLIVNILLTDQPKERPRLQLKPRTKPVEEPQAAPTQAAPKATSIFGGAKPVDTAAREREIEERLFRERHMSDKTAEPPRGAPRQRSVSLLDCFGVKETPCDIRSGFRIHEVNVS